jgi:hypothetical protein
MCPMTTWRLDPGQPIDLATHLHAVRAEPIDHFASSPLEPISSSSERGFLSHSSWLRRGTPGTGCRSHRVDREERIVLERGQFGLLDLEERGQPWPTTRSAPGGPGTRPHHLGDARARLPRRHSGPRTPQRPRISCWSQRRTADPVVVNEIHRLLATLVLAPLTCVDQVLCWSHSRRRRQYPDPRLPSPPPRSTPADMNRAPLQYQPSRKQQVPAGQRGRAQSRPRQRGARADGVFAMSDEFHRNQSLDEICRAP